MRRTMIIPSRVLLLTLVAASTAARSSDAQEFKSAVWGGAGGSSSYNLDCGSSGVMTGVYGKTGTWIDQLGITCRTVKSDGTLGDTYTRGPVGGAGGTSLTRGCPAGWVIGRVESYSGSYINRVSLWCFAWSASSRRLDYAVPKYIGVLGGIAMPGTAFNEAVTCPAEKLAKAFRGKSGSYIDSLQFVCDNWDK